MEQKTTEYNAKEPGKGDKWAKAWNDSRASLFQPAFLAEVNEKLEKQGVVVKENVTDAKYTLIIKTVYVNVGMNIGVMSREAYINMVVDAVETADHSKVVASVAMDNVMKQGKVDFGGMSFDFAVNQRLEGCYDQAGKRFGKVLSGGISSK